MPPPPVHMVQEAPTIGSAGFGMLGIDPPDIDIGMVVEPDEPMDVIELMSELLLEPVEDVELMSELLPGPLELVLVAGAAAALVLELLPEALELVLVAGAAAALVLELQRSDPA